MASNGKFRVAITPEFGDRTDELIGPALREVFDPHPDIEYELMAVDPEETGVPSVMDQYDAIIVFSYYFPAKSFEGVKRLACLSRWGVGYDRIDTVASSNADVAVAIAPLAVRRPVAEGIITLILALAKNLKHLDQRTSSGRWREGITAKSICIEGRTLGSVGVGSIAGEMFKMAKGIGFGRLLGYDPFISKERAEALGVELVDLDTLMRESDFVAVNTFLSNDTRGLVGAKQFELMKPTAYIINTARGPIIDEKALIAALQSGSIAGAGLDVFEEEPTPADNPLLHMENVIVAPHSIAWTQECIRDNSLHSCRAVLSIYKGEAPPHVANPQVIERPGFQAKLAARRS